MAVNIGPKIEVDGAAEYRKQINNIIQQSKTLDAEMRSVTEQYADAADAEEAVSAKSKVLVQQIGLQEQRMDLLRDQVEKAAAEYGELDDRTLKWKEALYNAEAQSKKYANQLDKLTSGTEEFEEAVEDTTAGQKELGQELNDLTRDMKGLEDAADDTGDTFKDVFTAGALLEGIKSIAGGLKDINEETQEYRKIMASLEVSSQKAGYTAEQTAESYRTLYGVLGDDQTAATTTANLQALGLAQGDLNRLINGTVGAWATYGDSIPIDSLSEAINETIQAGKVTGTFADVLNWAGTSEDAFNEQLATASSMAERTNMVLQELARQGLVEAGQAWQQNNRDIVDANLNTARWQENLAQLSERVSPLFNKVTSGLLDLTDAAMDLTEGVDFAPLMTGLGAVAGMAGTYKATTKAIELATAAQKAFNAAVEVAKPAAAAIASASPVIAGIGLLAVGIGTMWKALDEASLHLNEYTENALEAYDASVELADAAEITAADYWDMVEAWDAQGNAMGDVAARYDQLQTASQKATEEYDQALARQKELQKQIAEIQAEMDGGSGVMAENIDKLKIANDELEKVEESIADLAPVVENAEKRLHEMVTAMEDTTEVYIFTSEERKKAILAEAEASTDAFESIYGTASDMFSRLETESELSVDEMIENLRENQLALENWATNLQILAKRGVDDGLLAALQSLGPEGAKYVAELVTATDEQLAEMSLLWANAGTVATDALIGSIEAKTPAVTAGVQSLVRSAAMPDTSPFYSVGANMAQGMIDGMDDWQNAVARASARLAGVAVSAARGQLQIYSPSHVFRDDIVRDGIVAAYVTGMDKGQKDVAAHSALLAQSAVDGAAGVSFADHSFVPYSLPAGVAAGGSSTTNNNTSTFNVVVNAAEGQSAEEVADEVMHRLQFAVEQEEAVWR